VRKQSEAEAAGVVAHRVEHLLRDAKPLQPPPPAPGRSIFQRLDLVADRALQVQAAACGREAAALGDPHESRDAMRNGPSGILLSAISGQRVRQIGDCPS
jgi:hypothetical protein